MAQQAIDPLNGRLAVARNLIMLGFNIPSGDYRDRGYVQALMVPLEERVAAIPGVVAAGFIDQPPVLG
jgi:hypothetical protein